MYSQLSGVFLHFFSSLFATFALQIPLLCNLFPAAGKLVIINIVHHQRQTPCRRKDVASSSTFTAATMTVLTRGENRMSTLEGTVT